jgi:hypothetical protein
VNSAKDKRVHDNDLRDMLKWSAIESGDIVRHKDDGVVMLVRAVSGDSAYCMWFRGTALHDGTFLLSNLENVNEHHRPGRHGRSRC